MSGSIQTTMDTAAALGQEGMRANLSTRWDTITKVNGDAAAVPVGRVVCSDGANGDHLFILPAASTDIPLVWGITVIDGGDAFSQTSGAQTIAVGADARIMTSGLVWMIAEDAVDLNAAVFVRFTAGGAGETPGRVRSDADGMTPTAAELPGAYFRSTTTGANELVLVELNPQTA